MSQPPVKPHQITRANTSMMPIMQMIQRIAPAKFNPSATQSIGSAMWRRVAQ